MATTVIDDLELVKIHVTQCMLSILVLRTEQGAFQPDFELAPVNQASEHIVASLIAELGGGLQNLLLQVVMRPVQLAYHSVATRSNMLFFRMPIRQTEVQVDDFALTSTTAPAIQPVSGAPLGYVAIELSRKATMERQNEVLRSAALLTIAALIEYFHAGRD